MTHTPQRTRIAEFSSEGDTQPPTGATSTINSDCDPAARYWIAPHACACRTPSGVILLDLRRSKYFGLGRQESDAVAAIVHDWPRTHSEPRNEATYQVGLDELIRDLYGRGLLVAQANRATWACDVKLEGTLIAIGDELESSAPIRVTHMLRFISACVWSKWMLWFRSLEATAESIRACKAKQSYQSALDLSLAVDTVSVFRRLRPFVFTAKGHCLFHALVLVKFLSSFGIQATWTFGVATSPWRAHAWVQHGEYVMDSTPEKIVEFTPIFSV